MRAADDHSSDREEPAAPPDGKAEPVTRPGHPRQTMQLVMANRQAAVSQGRPLQRELRKLQERATAAQVRAAAARNNEERQHHLGMANYWDELLADRQKGLEP